MKSVIHYSWHRGQSNSVLWIFSRHHGWVQARLGYIWPHMFLCCYSNCLSLNWLTASVITSSYTSIWHTHRQNGPILGAIDFHSYSQLILRPWGQYSHIPVSLSMSGSDCYTFGHRLYKWELSRWRRTERVRRRDVPSSLSCKAFKLLLTVAYEKYLLSSLLHPAWKWVELACLSCTHYFV